VKSISNMTYLVSSGLLNLNLVNRFISKYIDNIMFLYSAPSGGMLLLQQPHYSVVCRIASLSSSSGLLLGPQEYRTWVHILYGLQNNIRVWKQKQKCLEVLSEGREWRMIPAAWYWLHHVLHNGRCQD